MIVPRESIFQHPIIHTKFGLAMIFITPKLNLDTKNGALQKKLSNMDFFTNYPKNPCASYGNTGLLLMTSSKGPQNRWQLDTKNDIAGIPSGQNLGSLLAFP